jgi:hypothetical protein
MIAPMCVDCTRFWDLIEKPKCEAFPDGIPDEIWEDGFDHRKPYPNDGNIFFQPINP